MEKNGKRRERSQIKNNASKFYNEQNLIIL